MSDAPSPTQESEAPPNAEPELHEVKLAQEGRTPHVEERETSRHAPNARANEPVALRERSPWAQRALTCLFGFAALSAAFCAGTWFNGDPQPSTHTHAPSGEERSQVWTCSMHPQIASPDPGLCPICAMDLIPRNEKQGGAPLTPSQLRLTKNAKLLARIQTTRVRPLAARGVSLELLGRVELDETSTHTVTPWTAGRVDRLHVEVTGTVLRKGQVVATLYSPDVYAAHQDLIQAVKQMERLKDATPFTKSAAQTTYNAARRRLQLLGVTSAEIKRMERAPRPRRQTPIRSAYSGTIVETLVREGQYVEAGAPLYRLADLETLWVQLDAYESDLPYIREGMEVFLSFEAAPERVVDGVIAFVDPVIDPQKRTARVRVEVPNQDGDLRPGMFVRAQIRPQNTSKDASVQLVIPTSAPLFSGKRSLVYVERLETQGAVYEAREVRLGPKMGDVYPVVAGLEYGESVVTHGAFRLDADLQLRGGQSLMTRPDDREPARFAGVIPLDDSSKKVLQPVYDHILDLHEALADDHLERAKEKAQMLLRALHNAKLKSRKAQGTWSRMQTEMIPHVEVLAGTGSMRRARLAFGEISVLFDQLLRTFGNVMKTPVRQAYCPMVDGDRGAYWYQREKILTNAYFGSQMLHCGWIQETIDPGSVAKRPQDQPPAPEPIEPSDRAPASSPASAPTSAPTSQPSP